LFVEPETNIWRFGFKVTFYNFVVDLKDRLGVKINTICQFCSAGCAVELNVNEGVNCSVLSVSGVVNPDGFICDCAIKGYQNIYDAERITQPLLKTLLGFRHISFDEAFLLIEEHIQEENPSENAFFAGARLSNEELYLIQKIARAGVVTNNLNSFHYLGRGTGYLQNTKANIPVNEILDTRVVYIIGDTLPIASPYTWHIIQRAKKEENVKVVWVTSTGNGVVSEIADEIVETHSIYSFLKLLNRHLIETGKADSFFTDEICLDFQTYKTNLLSEDVGEHLTQADVSSLDIEQFVDSFLEAGKAIVVYTEEALSGNTCREVHNLAMLTGKMGKYADGIVAIKEAVNSQGLIDMGIHPDYGQGAVDINDSEFLLKAQETWRVEKLPEKSSSDFYSVLNNAPKNLFIFGEDPIGDATTHKALIETYIAKAEFKVVQDLYMTPTAMMADLVMPSTYLFESGGTYTNTQKIIQQVGQQLPSNIEMNGFEQLAAIAKRLGLPEMKSPIEAMFESIAMFPDGCAQKRPRFVYTKHDDYFHI
jgi:predicted molibdopterin-dependent oxidoreductase YjgC